MTPWRFTDWFQVSRRVTVDSSGTASVVDHLEGYTAGQWIKTTINRPKLDRASHRLQRRTDLLRYRTGVRGPAGGPLRAGDRIQLDDTDYELTEPPRDVRISRSVEAQEALIVRVDELYPLEGAIQEQGGTPVKAGVRFNVYAGDQRHDDTGMYDYLTCETDLSNLGDVSINKAFVADSKIYKITAVDADLVGGYIRMSVRRSGV